MHLYLVSKHLIFVSDYFGPISSKLFHIPVNPWVPDDDLFAGRLHHAKNSLNKMRTSSSDWSVSINLAWKNGTFSPMLEINLEESEVFKAIGDLVYGGDKDKSLGITVTLGVTYQSNFLDRPKSLKIHKLLNLVTSGNSRSYKNRNGSLPAELHNRNNIMMRWFTLSISVDITEYVPLEDYQHQTLRVNQKLLKDASLSDFRIIAADGSSFPCHKIFLHAQSDVLAAMLESEFKEARLNEMKMEDMPADGVKSLLEFLYCGDVRGAVRDCKVALSLFIAADKYNIENLGNAMSDLLHGKSHKWYDVKTAFKLYEFLMKYQDKHRERLVPKMLGVLGRKYNELESSTLFDGIPNANIVKDMFLQSLKSSWETFHQP